MILAESRGKAEIGVPVQFARVNQQFVEDSAAGVQGFGKLEVSALLVFFLDFSRRFLADVGDSEDQFLALAVLGWGAVFDEPQGIREASGFLLFHAANYGQA